MPHHLVFIADPQLVDPHTYPGRPWPLSTLTERYTDAYMTRNFRLTNEKLDPDSVVFLGDLFDGGREWATSRARPLKPSQRRRLEAMGIAKPEKGSEGEQVKILDSDGREMFVKQKEAASYREHKATGPDGKLGKRSLESYKAAFRVPHSHHITKEEHNLDKRGNDLREFVHGENGRWKKWGPAQWDKEYERFGRIFFDPKQLYPNSERSLLHAYDIEADPVSIENGGKEGIRQEYAIANGKHRHLLTSLPGNHDLGFGPGVQMAVRDRFNSHFGEGDRVDVIGNHTFVSLDVLSLAANAQFEPNGYETTGEQAEQWKHIWKPGIDFLSDIRESARRAVSEGLSEYYPEQHGNQGYYHQTTGDIGQPQRLAQMEDKITQPQLPVILLTHVPLYRDPETHCGPLRERDTAISVSGGYQYQNVLTRTLSNIIMQKVSTAGDVVHVFSGDDHDYCEVDHRYNVPRGDGLGPKLLQIKEITVKSFSWAMGVRHPGFLLVSLWNPVDANGETIGTPLPTVQTHLCLLPDQLGIFIHYALMLAFTLLVLLLRAVVLALRGPAAMDVDDGADSPARKYSLPRYQPKANGTANGWSTPNKADVKGRQRASSSSNNVGANGNLGIQRSMTARTRSVSPAVGGYGLPDIANSSGPLIEKAGYYPQVRWTDPADDESDEESHIGTIEEETDSQAKWKKRRRTPGRAHHAWQELWESVLIVALPVFSWYVVLIRSG